MNSSAPASHAAHAATPDLVSCSATDLDTFFRAQRAVAEAKQAAIRTLALLAFRAALNGRK